VIWKGRGGLLYYSPTGRKPTVGFLHTFSFVKDKRLGLKKLDDRSALMVFIGYTEGAKA
jgi:hypothetical protein